MAKLTDLQKKRYARRFGTHQCSICQLKFEAWELKDNTPVYVPKSRHMKSRFKIKVNTFELTLNNVCDACAEHITNSVAEFIREHYIK